MMDRFDVPPQPPLRVQVLRDKNGKMISISPNKDSVVLFARWFENVDRQLQQTQNPEQKIGNIIIHDEDGKPVAFLPVGIMGDYLTDQESNWKIGRWFGDKLGTK